MKKLLEDPEKFYDPKKRPSGHNINTGFGKDNGGAIPSNLLQIPNSDSNGQYLRGCKALGLKAHPARFPSKYQIRQISADLRTGLIAMLSITGLLSGCR
jgi:hypothetical protein